MSAPQKPEVRSESQVSSSAQPSGALMRRISRRACQRISSSPSGDVASRKAKRDAAFLGITLHGPCYNVFNTDMCTTQNIFDSNQFSLRKF